MPFEGIPLAALDFYEDLEGDNSKAFWQANREVYELQIKAPLAALALELEPKFGAYKLFRPYRDVRFSKDKTPYKTHQGIWFGETSRYLHVSGAGLFLAAGYWHTSSPQVGRLRRAVDDDIAGPQLAKAVTSVRRRGYEVGGEQLTRVPSGFDKEHERADLLKHKTLVASRELLAPDWLTTERARAEITKCWQAMAPVVDWLDTHVGHD